MTTISILPKTATRFRCLSRPCGVTYLCRASHQSHRWSSSSSKFLNDDRAEIGGKVAIAIAATLVSGTLAYVLGRRRAEEKHVKTKDYSSPEKFERPIYGNIEDMKNVSEYKLQFWDFPLWSPRARKQPAPCDQALTILIGDQRNKRGFTTRNNINRSRRPPCTRLLRVVIHKHWNTPHRCCVP